MTHCTGWQELEQWKIKQVLLFSYSICSSCMHNLDKLALAVLVKDAKRLVLTWADATKWRLLMWHANLILFSVPTTRLSKAQITSSTPLASSCRLLAGKQKVLGRPNLQCAGMVVPKMAWRNSLEAKQILYSFVLLVPYRKKSLPDWVLS
jgi:hypothetical protein